MEDIIFFADVLTASTVAWRGIHMEFFDTNDLGPSVGQRVRCLYVVRTRQVFLLDVMS